MTLESVVSVPIRSPIHFRLANRCQILDQTDKLSTLQTNLPKCLGCIPNMIYTMMWRLVWIMIPIVRRALNQVCLTNYNLLKQPFLITWKKTQEKPNADEYILSKATFNDRRQYFLFFIFYSVRLCRFCVVIRVFHPRHNGQWPPTLKDFLSQIVSITFIYPVFSLLNVQC